MIYVLLGPPASGKSTQAKLLAKERHIPFYSVGALLRAKAKHDRHLAEQVNNGILVPPQTVVSLLRAVSEEHPDGLILDGAFRRPEQIEKIMHLWDKSRVVVIHLTIPEDEIRKRAQKRDQERKDDKPDIVEKRIVRYYTALPSILGRLESFDIPIITVDGAQTITAIHKIILKELKKYDRSTKKS